MLTVYYRNEILKHSFRLNINSPDLVDLSHKIESAAAPLLRPVSLVKVGQPQPAMLRLAGDLAQRAKSAKVLPSLESELRNAIAKAEGATVKTKTGQEFPTKIFNQVLTLVCSFST